MGARNTADEVLSSIPPRPIRFPVTLALISVLLVCAVVMVVCGLGFFGLGAAPVSVRILVIVLGAGLAGFLAWRLTKGAGRHTAVVTDLTSMHVAAIAGFGMPMGFALFDVITGQGSTVHLALLISSVIGMLTSLVVFVRDVDLLDVPIELIVLPSAAGTATPVSQPEEVEEIFFDPTDDEPFVEEPSMPVATMVRAPQFHENEPEAMTTAMRRAIAADEDDQDDQPPAAPRRAARRAADELS